MWVRNERSWVCGSGAGFMIGNERGDVGAFRLSLTVGVVPSQFLFKGTNSLQVRSSV